MCILYNWQNLYVDYRNVIFNAKLLFRNYMLYFDMKAEKNTWCTFVGSGATPGLMLDGSMIIENKFSGWFFLFLALRGALILQGITLILFLTLTGKANL